VPSRLGVLAGRFAPSAHSEGRGGGAAPAPVSGLRTGLPSVRSATVCAGQRSRSGWTGRQSTAPGWPTAL